MADSVVKVLLEISDLVLATCVYEVAVSVSARNTLLVVDDDQELLALIAEIGRRTGYLVVTADSSASFRRALSQSPPSLVILDLQLADMDGVEALRHLAATNNAADVLLLSGMESKVLSTARQLGLSLGLSMLGALQKPVRMSDLEATLRKYKGEHAQLTADEVRTALNEYELVLHYQPILHRVAHTWTVGAVEALVRWQHPTRGLLHPAQFLPLVDRENMMTELTDFVLTEALRQVGHWHSRGLHVGVSVNLAARTVADLNFPDRLSDVLREYDVPASYLCFDVTEGALAGDQDLVLDNFARLRVRGVELALDDFGVGTSSVTQLYKMPYNCLKIDHSLIGEMATSQQARTVVSALVELGHKLSLSVCAEGVESQLAFDRLDRMGCDYLQGEYISTAITASEVEAFIRAWDAGQHQDSALLAG
jgi:EAL domain-containing protein (putative c-di-GMP-specific phosphodiesterase class I)/AmiR/NasT family two-component response regulator